MVRKWTLSVRSCPVTQPGQARSGEAISVTSLISGETQGDRLYAEPYSKRSNGDWGYSRGDTYRMGRMV